MKLHRIGVTNLNSLYGTHTVDLDRDLEGASLFLIQGPTGSGKSTLMDAVSLALFGTTPRMEAQRSGDSVAEQVMSRDTGSCEAELVFSKWSHEEGRRIHYRARWAARRAREKPDGQVQRPERSLERRTGEGDWEILVSDHRTKFYQPRFDEVLEEFSQEDFRRSMLLAQGQFDAMLHAKPDERARILERLTDTSEYKRLGERAARIHRAWRERIRDLDRDLQTREPVDPEAIEKAEREAAESGAALARVEERTEAVRIRRDWLSTEADRAGKVEEAEKRHEGAREALESRAELAARIDEHDRCVDGFSALDAVAGQRTRVAEADRAIRDLEGRLPALGEALEAATAHHDAWAARHAAAEAAYRELEPVVARAEASRIRRVELERTRSRAEAAAGRARDELETRRTRLMEAEAAWENARAELERERAGEAAPEEDSPWRAGVEAVLRDHRIPSAGSGDEGPRFDDAADAIRDLRDEVGARRTAVQGALEARAALEGAEAEREAREEARKAAGEAVDAATEAVRKAEEERESTRERLRRAREVMAPLERIRVHHEERRKLEEGKPCPLCGSEHHPLAAEEADAAIRKEIDGAQSELEAAEEAFRVAEAFFHDAEGGRKAARLQMEERQEEVAAAQGRLEEARRAWIVRARDVDVVPETPRERLRLLDDDLDAVGGWLQRVLERVTTGAGRFAAWATARAEIDSAEARVREAEHDRAGAVEAAEEARRTFEAEMEELRSSWSAAVSLDGDHTPARPEVADDPSALKESQRTVVQALARAVEEAREGRGAAEQAVTRAESELATRRTGRDADAAGLSTLEEELAATMTRLEVSTTEELAERRLPEDVLREGRREVEGLRRSLEATKTRLDTLRREHEAHAEAKPDPFDLEWLEGELSPERCAAALDALSGERIVLNETFSRARSVLLHAERVAKEIETLRAARDRTGAQAEIWERLHDLIGKNDGERFRQFAQALNLDQLLDRANRHLATLKDRYRLVTVRDSDTGMPTLEFEVEDRWRPGSTRSLKTLSGGEGFLVSLALALGLSDLRTSSMPVETLLLDEGFGTLDPETLDEALAALQQLQASGRQIGIISHVAGLQERIDARIRVEPLGNGRSQVRAMVAGLG